MAKRFAPMPKPDLDEIRRLLLRAGLPHERWRDKQRLARVLGLSEETVRLWLKEGRGPGWLHSWVNIYAKLSEIQRANHETEMDAQRPQRLASATAA